MPLRECLPHQAGPRVFARIAPVYADAVLLFMWMCVCVFSYRAGVKNTDDDDDEKGCDAETRVSGSGGGWQKASCCGVSNTRAHAQHIRYTYNGRAVSCSGSHKLRACVPVPVCVCSQKNHQLFTGAPARYGSRSSSSSRATRR